MPLVPTLSKVTKTHPIQAGLGVLLMLTCLGISADAAAQDAATSLLTPETASSLASNPWALVVGAAVVVGGQIAAAWKEHLAGHKARADELAGRVRELEVEAAALRERALRAELTQRP